MDSTTGLIARSFIVDEFRGMLFKLHPSNSDMLPWALAVCHLSGMGSFTAVGGIKAGEKSVTAFETQDCATALAVAKFKSFAKPGGSSYVVSYVVCLGCTSGIDFFS